MHLGVGKWKEIQVREEKGRRTAATARAQKNARPLVVSSSLSPSPPLHTHTHQESGLLPGKLTQQLNGQTQRLLGQQSLAAYTGLKVRKDGRDENEMD